MSFFKDIQALKDTEVGSGQPNAFSLTPLGRHLAELPCSPKIGRLLVYGALLGCTGSLGILVNCRKR